jgi:hypothetical protein
VRSDLAQGRGSMNVRTGHHENTDAGWTSVGTVYSRI